MPKYVLKEDVEAGKVDPTKSLDEQPEYKKKMEEEHEKKHKNQQQRPQRQRPKKERPPRKERPQFNWNRNDITLESKAPDQPKKLLQKPDAQKHREGFQKFKAERQALKTQRQGLIEEQRMIIRDIKESEKYGREASTQYNGVMSEKKKNENQLRKEIKLIDDQKKKIYAQISHYQAKVEELRRPSDPSGYSIEGLRQRIAEKEHQLTTSNINKKEESRLTTEINELKRALNNAKPSIEIESEINKLNDQIQILQKQLKPIKHDLHVKITQANEYKAEIAKLKQQSEPEKNPKEKKTVEEVKAEYDIKLKAIEEKRDKLEQKIDDYMDKHTRNMDDYEDQQDLLRYIEWVKNQVDRLKKKQEEQAEREKRKIEQEKKRQKEKEDYEKRQKARKQKEEAWKKEKQQRKQKYEKEKQAFLSRNPNFQTIDLCHSLIDYCQGLRPVAYQYEDPRSKNAGGEIKFGKDWQKQIKGGAQVIVSKKSQKDEEVKKQPVKTSNKKKQQDQNFEHGIQVMNQFQAVNLLPPNNVGEIDSTIKLINEKIEFYNNPSEEEKAAFREKSLQIWEERHQPRDRDRDNKKGGFKEKNDDDQGEAPAPKKQKKEYNNKKSKKAEITEGDFPELA